MKKEYGKGYLLELCLDVAGARTVEDEEDLGTADGAGSKERLEAVLAKARSTGDPEGSAPEKGSQGTGGRGPGATKGKAILQEGNADDFETPMFIPPTARPLIAMVMDALIDSGAVVELVEPEADRHSTKSRRARPPIEQLVAAGDDIGRRSAQSLVLPVDAAYLSATRIKLLLRLAESTREYCCKFSWMMRDCF